MHLIDFYNFKPPAELLVNRDESQAIRVNAAKTSLVRALGCRPDVPDGACSSQIIGRIPWHVQHHQSASSAGASGAAAA
jgi:hypothetical protein